MSAPSTNDNWTGGNAEWSTNGDWSAGTPNGADYAATLSNGATITVGSGDFTASAGTLSITSGSLAIQGALNLGGLSVTSGSVTVNAGSLSTGTETLAFTYNQTGNILVENFGGLTVENGVNGTVSGTVTLASGGQYIWEDALVSSSSGNIVDFADGSGSNFNVQAAFGGSVEGFQAGDSITDNVGTGNATSSFGSNSVTVTRGGQSITINFTGGTYNSSNVSVDSSGNITFAPPVVAAATITSESDSSPSGADIDANKTVTFTVNFSAAVTATGSPELTLTGGRTASLTSGSGTSALVFSYTVQPGDNVADLEATAFNLNNGTIQNGGVNADLCGFTTINTGVQLDTTPPSARSIARASSSLNNASRESYTVTFSESVTGVDASDFTAATTGTIADSGITVTPISGRDYRVTVNGVTRDGTLGLNLNSSGTGITDAAGNAISGGFTGQTYTVDHTAPSISSVSVPANATYVAGQHLDFIANFNEAVTVTGTPEIALTLGTGVVDAQYISGSGTSS